MYENLELGLDLKLLFMVTVAYYESGLLVRCLIEENRANGFKFPLLQHISAATVSLLMAMKETYCTMTMGNRGWMGEGGGGLLNI